MYTSYCATADRRLGFYERSMTVGLLQINSIESSSVAGGISTASMLPGISSERKYLQSHFSLESLSWVVLNTRS